MRFRPAKAETDTEMATEKPTLAAPEEQVSREAEDVQSNPAPTEPVVENSVVAAPVAEPAAMLETVVETDPESSQIDFADEEAVLAAQQAGLEIEGVTAEEAEQLDVEVSVEEKFAGKSKEELLEQFDRMLAEQPVQAIRRDVEALKIAFYRLRRAEVETARRAFIDGGGSEEEFVPTVDGAEVRLKELFKEYRRRRDEFIANLEAEKEQNYRTKLAIIDELKELVDSDETLNHTFNKFRELQQRWKETGPVPLQQVKDLWETYNLHVENFYNFIKINKELRDLDLKKNYEQKAALCEQAEALVLEPSVIEAFHKLQKLHDAWRETGPVANEFKETLWGAVQGRFEPHQQAASGAFRGTQSRAGEKPRTQDGTLRRSRGAQRAAVDHPQGVE